MFRSSRSTRRTLTRGHRRTLAVFVAHVCAPGSGPPDVDVPIEATLDEIDLALAEAPRVARRGVSALLWFLEWGGPVLWGAALAFAAAGFALGRVTGAVIGLALALPGLLWQRPPPLPLSWLPARWQRAYFASMAGDRLYLRRIGFRVVALLAMTAHYGRPEMQRALGWDGAGRAAWSRAVANPRSRLGPGGEPAGDEGVPGDGDTIEYAPGRRPEDAA